MRRQTTALALFSALAPAIAQAEGSFALSAGAMSGGFLTQQDQFGFGDGEDNYFTTLAYEDTTGPIRYRASFGFDSDDAALNFDDSYIEQSYGNWTLGAGAKDRHWGPSNYTSMVLSDNARPVQGVYLSKDPSSFEAAWLDWVGDWSGDIIVGQLGEHTGPSNTKLLGMRLEIEPFDGFSAEFVRMVQFGGDGRDNSVETFLKLLSVVFDANSIQSNTIAGLGLSYQWQNLPLRTYFQAVGEDEAGFLPSCWMYLAGAEWQTEIGGHRSTFTLEVTDTTIDRTVSGFCGPNTAYRNGQYASGYSNFGKVMGSPVDTEGTSIVLYAEHDLEAFDLSWSVGQYDLNKANLASHRLSATNVSGLMATVGASKTWEDTTLSGVITYQGFDTTNASEGVSVGFQISRSF